MNSTPKSERFYIGIFGRCNSGKSSLINALTNQKISVVSPKKGTTTDNVSKAIELNNLGPCVFVDTPGFDDDEKDILGKIRIKKSVETMEIINAAILVLKDKNYLDENEKKIIEKLNIKKIPLIVVINIFKEKIEMNDKLDEKNYIAVNAKTKENINNLTTLICDRFKDFVKQNDIIKDLLKPLDIIVLVIVMDSAYPKARLILPQQQLINDVLTAGAICYVCRNFEYEDLIKNLKVKPKLIITDSQIFDEIFKKTPKEYLITSFSILLARKKGVLKESIKGVKSLKNLKDGDTILICESCTHKKKSCDLGSVKIPNWIKKYTNKKINFEFLTGCDFEQNIKKYSLIIHCGGCMTTEKIIKQRFNIAKKNKIPMTNYGILIAYLNNVLEKSVSFLDKLKNLNS